jgi:hypothetical protein
VQYVTFVDEKDKEHILLTHAIRPEVDPATQSLDIQHGTDVTSTILSQDNGFLKFVYNNITVYCKS